MARSRQRNAVVIALLEATLQAAREGIVDGLFIMIRDNDGEWAEDFEVADMDDLQYELRSCVIRVSEAMKPDPVLPDPLPN